MISINNLSIEFSSKPLFSNVSFVVNDSDKIALTGKNGAGKSTLLKIIAGLQTQYSGSIGKPSDFKIGYLPQEMSFNDDTTLIEETKKAFASTIEKVDKVEELTNKLSVITDYEDPAYQKVLNQLDILTNQLKIESINNIEAEVERTLIGLGFKREDFNRPTKEFSGGWRMRIELAKILLAAPDLLLLDEPTNHLDIESIQWLESFIKNKAKGVVLVSHDRAFLDNVTSRTIEISCGKIYDYKVNYSNFENLRRERIEQQTRAYENQQKLIQDTKDFIERFRYKATKAVQVQSRIKQLEKIVPIEIDETDNSTLNLKFPPAQRSGDYPLIVESLRKSYGEHNVFSGAEYTLKRGDKVAFVGKNGEGKSTMVKCIMNEIPFEGNLKIGHNVKIGYFAQNQAQLLNKNKTVFETIDEVATGDIRTRIKDILGAFMFRGEDIDKKVEVLSGGEKTRLAMIRLLLEPVNFLILDEPTNHLDMKTKDVLKSAIKDFTGTVIVVSHDRSFLDGLVDKVYEFDSGKVTENLGGIYDYLRKKKVNDFNELQISLKNNRETGKDSLKENGNSLENNNKSVGQIEYSLKKERDKKIRKATKEVETAEKKIEELEANIQEIEAKLSKGETSNEIFSDYERVKEELDSTMLAWEKAQENLESILNELN